MVGEGRVCTDFAKYILAQDRAFGNGNVLQISRLDIIMYMWEYAGALRPVPKILFDRR